MQIYHILLQILQQKKKQRAIPVNIKALTAFKYVYTKGSIVSASQYMHLSVSALSRMISNLEYTLQLQLFIREGKQLIPTVEAIEFYPEVERILENIEKNVQCGWRFTAGRTKNLRIISVPKMAQFFICTCHN